jgi:hypothetical protein
MNYIVSLELLHNLSQPQNLYIMKQVKNKTNSELNEISICISKIHLVKFKSSSKSNQWFERLYEIENELRFLIESKLKEVSTVR